MKKSILKIAPILVLLILGQFLRISEHNYSEVEFGESYPFSHQVTELHANVYLMKEDSRIGFKPDTLIKDELINNQQTYQEFVRVEKQNNQTLTLVETTVLLQEGYTYLTVNNLKGLLKLAILPDADSFSDADLQVLTRPHILKQRDIFPLNTYTNEIIIPQTGSYRVIYYQATPQSLSPKFDTFIKRNSAMTREDLHTWSASYTDSTVTSVINNGAEYVNMAKYAPDIVSWSQVSTPLNRTHQVLDEEDITIQRRDFADMLIKVNAELMTHGYRLMIYDGYREKASTAKLYEYTLRDIEKTSNREYPEVTMDNLNLYVVSPKALSDRHGKGTAADVTLVRMATGEVVNMPTRVNTMNRDAWIDRTRAKSEEYELLYRAMVNANMRILNSEWYHYSYIFPNEHNFPIGNLRKSFYPEGKMNNVPSAWAKESIDAIVKMGIVSVSRKSDFKRAITRQEFIEMVVRLSEHSTSLIVDKSLNGFFMDSPLSSSSLARQLGLMKGHDDQFSPNSSMTRKEASDVLSQMYQLLYNVEPKRPSSLKKNSLDIASRVMPSIIDLTEWDMMNHYMNGYSTPKTYLSREEAFVMIYRLSQLIEFGQRLKRV